MISEILRIINFNSGEKTKVKESWARGVQWELTRMVYPLYNVGYDPANPDYTLMVKDMIDNDNLYGTTFLTGEQVNGYTIRQVEDGLLAFTWNNWRDNIKYLYNNNTENHVDTLFNYWN